ncbi:MAG: hypothetical protein QM640_03495 [Niabella sp.]
MKKTNGMPLPYATISVESLTDSSILAFAQTDKNGLYKIVYTGDFPVWLAATSLGYTKKYIIINAPGAATISFDLVLIEKIKELDEVIVRSTPKVYVSGDTTSYNLSSFTIGNERALEDALNRLPGFSISENGRISVNGRPIQKILIEGDDIVNQNYTLLSKNLSPAIISQVQVLDKYLDDPLLKGIEKTGDVALNLTFKNQFKKTFLSEIGLEGGGDSRYRVSANSILLSKNTKAYTIVNGNNIGDAPDLISNTEVLPRSTLALAYNPLHEQARFVDITPADAPLIDRKRSLFNQTKTASLNLLNKWGEQLNTKINMTVYGDKNTNVKNSRNTYFTNTDTLEYQEQNNWQLRPVDIEGNFSTSYNFSSKARLQYNFMIRSQNHREAANIIFNSNEFSQNLSSQTTTYQNHLNYTLKTKSNDALVIDGAQYRIRARQNYNVSGYDYTSVFQQVSDELYQNSDNPVSYVGGQAKYYTQWKDARLIYNAGYDQYKENVWSVTDSENSLINPVYSNNVSVTNDRLFFRTDLNNTYFNTKLEMTARMGFEYISLLKDSVYELNIKTADFFIKPDISFRYNVSAKSKLTASYRYNRYFPDAKHLYDNFIFSDYRTVTRYSNNYLLQKENKVSLAYRYNDNYNLFSGFINAFYTNKQNNFVDSISIRLDINQSVQFQRPNQTRTLGLLYGFDQFISPLSSTIKINGNFTNSSHINYLNNIERRVINRIFGNQLAFMTAFDGFFNCVGKMQYYMIRNRVSTFQGAYTSESHSSSISVRTDYRLNKKYFLQLDASRLQWTWSGKNQQPVYFMDATFWGDLIKDKLSISATLRNAFNNRSLYYSSISDYMFNLTEYSLMPRIFVMGCKYRF